MVKKNYETSLQNTELQRLLMLLTNHSTNTIGVLEIVKIGFLPLIKLSQFCISIHFHQKRRRRSNVWRKALKEQKIIFIPSTIINKPQELSTILYHLAEHLSRLMN